MSRQSKNLSGEVDLLQGTLDMLILRVVALRPIHGYAILQRIQQLSGDALQIRLPAAMTSFLFLPRRARYGLVRRGGIE